MSEPTRYAVVVGVNESPASAAQLRPLLYAENDARAVHATLTDRGTGLFPVENVDLLVGPAATARAVKRALRLRSRAMREQDFLLVYFSGHGFVPQWSMTSELYLACQDTDVDALENEPDSALRVGFLKHDVFEEVVGTSLFILDACLAAEYDALDPLIPPTFTGRHAALLATSPNGSVRESADLQHGTFTDDLLTGLRGEAANDAGEVTTENLYLWLARKGRQNPLHHARNWSNYVALTNPGPQASPRPESVVDLPRIVDLQAMRTPMDDVVRPLNEFMGRLLDSVIDAPGTAEGISRYRLDVLRRAFMADSACICTVDDRSVLRFQQWCEPNQLQDHATSLGDLHSSIRRQTNSVLGHQAVLSDGSIVYAVRLRAVRHDIDEMLFVLNPKMDVTELGEPIAVLVETFLSSSRDRGDSLRMLELRLLTELRREFGRLPLKLYERAFLLYRSELDGIGVTFEPIVKLENDGSCGGVRSFEALARRRPGDRSAPGYLLGLASVWGDRFTVERDQIIAATALTRYRAAQDEMGGGGLIPPVAINVAIASLLSPGYVAALREAISANRLERGVTLEISERDEIILPSSMSAPAGPMETFRQYLINLSRNLEVHFAIDDFGVGHSSLDRLSVLSLTQIKIDRSILRHPCRLDELRLVMKIANETLVGGGPDARVVVLEGLDESILGPPGQQSLMLRDIYTAGIRFIQGYVTGDPSTIDLRASREELTQRIQRYW